MLQTYRVTDAQARWERMDEVLAPADTHAAVGDQVSRFHSLPVPFRWMAQLASGMVNTLAKGLTRRQKAYNLSILSAVQVMAQRIRNLEQQNHLSSTTPGDDRPDSFATVFAVEGISWMTFPERVLLYGLIYSSRPERVLEIGTFQGGSARIITAAMDDAGKGQLYCVDPNPRMTAETAAAIEHRATIIAHPSPEALQDAERLAGAKFDFALIDGDHSYNGVVRDIEGTLPVMLPGSLLLFHDAYYEPVQRGIDAMKQKYPALAEVGMLSSLANPDPDNPGTIWGGIRVLRYDPKE